MNQKKRQGQKTRAQLITHAQKLFAQKGYHHTRFDQVALSKGFTTGALYHHFKSKSDLFEAVFEACSAAVAERVFRAADKHEDILDGIVGGCVEYIRAVTARPFRKIMLEDSISVLGWRKWKEIDEKTSERGLLLAIEEAQHEGRIGRDLSAQALTRFVSGGTNELALWVSAARNKKARLAEVTTLLARNLASLNPGEDHAQ